MALEPQENQGDITPLDELKYTDPHKYDEMIAEAMDDQEQPVKKLEDIVDSDTQASEVRAVIYTMLANASSELMNSGKELTASNLLHVINQKVDEL